VRLGRGTCARGGGYLPLSPTGMIVTGSRLMPSCSHNIADVCPQRVLTLEAFRAAVKSVVGLESIWRRYAIWTHPQGCTLAGDINSHDVVLWTRGSKWKPDVRYQVRQFSHGTHATRHPLSQMDSRLDSSPGPDYVAYYSEYIADVTETTALLTAIVALAIKRQRWPDMTERDYADVVKDVPITPSMRPLILPDPRIELECMCGGTWSLLDPGTAVWEQIRARVDSPTLPPVYVTDCFETDPKVWKSRQHSHLIRGKVYVLHSTV
jgi:hypothetical protein